MSIFEKAEKHPQRLKMYVFGDTGTGKTVTALHFPGVAFIDTEKGTEYYGEYFDFHRIQTSDPDKINGALDELLENPGNFKTVVIDPFPHVYDAILEKRLRHQRRKTGSPDYQIQPLDYKFIKGEVKAIIKKLLALDMNIIVTAPSKTLYSTEKEDFMKVIGTDADGPKQLPFMFDVVLELKSEGKKRLAFARKDRTNKLPFNEWFEFSYPSFVKYIGVEGLERNAVVFRQQQELEARNERTTKVTYNGKELLTAGVQPDSLKKLEILAKRSPDLKQKLMEDYLVESVLDLREDEALLLIDELTKK